MRIDLHCHTKKVKTGDAYTRNVTKDKFFQKVIEAEVKIIAITNHNQFDYMQYKEFKDVTEGYCDIWPGVELDIIGKADQKGNCKRGHLIVIANPKNVELFNTQVQELVNDEDVNTFQIGVKKVYETLGKCDCIYIPHFHKEPKLSDEDIQELRELLPDSSRLFKETSDYRSLGVFSNFDYSVIIGSDVQDWNKYETFSVEDKVEKEYLGNLEEKGDIYIQTRYRMLTKESRTDEFKQGITVLRNCKLVIDGIKKAVLAENISEEVSKFQEFYDDGIKDIGAFIGVSKETALENGEIYRPSNGERGILLMQKLLDSESDVYILDEPELGMGNSYITSNILPKLTDLAKRRKTVIIATHNANIAVGTLPYISILRTHENGIYKTYVGNPFYDELRNIDDETDTKNWTQESMHTLEGGKTAFYDRKDIYESGKQSD